jgi:uncharacterized SAM-binding protein YcdF (DUF218 family)
MDFWFVFKKITAIGLTPVSITLELVIVGLFLVGFSRRGGKKAPSPKWLWCKGISGDVGGFMIWGAALFLYLCSIETVAYGLSGFLEKKYPVIDEVSHEPDYIVVLPGGHRFSVSKSENSQVERKTLVRLLKGIEYWKQFPDSTLVFTGLPEEVEPMRGIATQMGVDSEKIFCESESLDTKDHPRYLKELLKDKEFLLVTSGNHMPRSVALFTGQGLTPTPAPTDLHYSPLRPFSVKKLIPQVRHLLVTDEAFHEHLGIGWAAMRRQLKERKEARIAFQDPESPVKVSAVAKSSIVEL